LWAHSIGRQQDLKVAFVHQPLGTLSVPVQEGSIAIWIYEVARRLAKSNDVVVYARKGRHQKELEIREGVTYRRISTELDNRLFRFLEDHPSLTRLPGVRNPKLPFFARNLAHLEYGLKVAWDLGLQRCDVVHIKNFSQLAPIIKAFNPKTKIVLHMQSYWLTQLDRATIEQRLSSCDAIVGCSEHVIGQVRLAFPSFNERCHVIPNGVDLESFSPAGQARTPAEGIKRLLFVGRVSPEKGLHVLLEAFKNVAEQRPEVQLTVIGPESVPPLEFIVSLSDEPGVSQLARFYPGSYLAQLRQMLSPELARRVSFVSNLAHPEVIGFYRTADVLVNPSLLETFGMTLAEAMGCGVPVVATRVGGMTEVVADGKSGILVEPDNPSALAQAMLRLVSDDELRKSMGYTGRARAFNLFSWDRISERTFELHNQLVNEGKWSDEWTSSKRGYASLQC
jgi:spore coat protein SA